MTDADGDGYGSATPAEGVVAGTDCDDSDATVNPGVTEIANNGKDDDCDPTTPDIDCDLDGDGDVDAADLAIFSQYYGTVE
jgi:hypothetical protein